MRRGHPSTHRTDGRYLASELTAITQIWLCLALFTEMKRTSSIISLHSSAVSLSPSLPHPTAAAADCVALFGRCLCCSDIANPMPRLWWKSLMYFWLSVWSSLRAIRSAIHLDRLSSLIEPMLWWKRIVLRRSTIAETAENGHVKTEP